MAVSRIMSDSYRWFIRAREAAGHADTVPFTGLPSSPRVKLVLTMVGGRAAKQRGKGVLRCTRSNWAVALMRDAGQA